MFAGPILLRKKPRNCFVFWMRVISSGLWKLTAPIWLSGHIVRHLYDKTNALLVKNEGGQRQSAIPATLSDLIESPVGVTLYI